MKHHVWSGSLLLAVSLALITTAHAQSGANSPKAGSKRTTQCKSGEAAVGTFQLVPLSQKVAVAITTDALAEIESQRREDAEVHWQINAFARVRILPRRVINTRGFKPLAPVAPVAE